MSLSKAKFTFGDSHGFPFKETLSEAKSRLLINFLLPTLLPGHLQHVHGIFLVYSALVDVNRQDNRCDTKSDVIAILLGGHICQWNKTFRSSTSEHTSQTTSYSVTDVFQLHRTDMELPICTQRIKFQDFLLPPPFSIPMQGWVTISELNFFTEHLKNLVWESSFFPCSLLQIRQSTKADVT